MLTAVIRMPCQDAPRPVDLLSENIGEGTYRAEPRGDGAGSALEIGWGAGMSEAASALR